MHKCGKCGDQILDTTLRSQQQVDRHKRLGTSGRDDTPSDLKVETANVELCRAEECLVFWAELQSNTGRDRRGVNGCGDAKSWVFLRD